MFSLFLFGVFCGAALSCFANISLGKFDIAGRLYFNSILAVIWVFMLSLCFFLAKSWDAVVSNRDITTSVFKQFIF